MKVVLKELRETFVCLRVIEKAAILSDHPELILTKQESNELISIFVKSINTAQRNSKK